MIDTHLFAYFAGMIDGDGYISVQSRPYKSTHYFWPRVGIAGTKRSPLDMASSLWGGSVSSHAPRNPRHKTQFQWSRVSNDAIAVITAIRPYLLIKCEQADLAIELWEHLEEGRSDNPYPWTADGYNPIRRSLELKLEIASLNQWRRRREDKVRPIPADLMIRQFPSPQPVHA